MNSQNQTTPVSTDNAPVNNGISSNTSPIVLPNIEHHGTGDIKVDVHVYGTSGVSTQPSAADKLNIENPAVRWAAVLVNWLPSLFKVNKFICYIVVAGLLFLGTLYIANKYSNCDNFDHWLYSFVSYFFVMAIIGVLFRFKK